MIAKPSGYAINFPSVFTSNWESQDKRNAQFFVNYLPEVQEITLNADGLKEVKIFKNAEDVTGIEKNENLIKLEIAPLNAIMISYQ